MKYVLGIDVGGTKVAAGLVNSSFLVTKTAILPTSQTNLSAQLVRLIESYDKFDAIGLGMPGRVLADGTVIRLPHIKSFKIVNLKRLLEKKFHVPVHVMNDSKAFTLAEASVGSGKKLETVVGIILGTGIGSGLVRDKKIYYGKNRMAGQIGHIVIDGKMTLEQQMKKLGTITNSKQLAPILKIILSLIVRTLDPDIIVFGGGRTNQIGMQKVLDQTFERVFPYRVKTLLRISKLKHAGIIGAVLPLLKR